MSDTVGANAVSLRNHAYAATDREQIDDVQVLDGLRHDAVVRRDDQHDVIDAAYAREHVAHESLVSGNIDETDGVVMRCLPVREAEIYRNAACLFLGQPVGVDAGQRFDERRLAVIDVTCRRDNHFFNLTEVSL